MKIQPLSDRVVLKAIQKDTITNSWIYIPENSNKERPYMYTVISVWPGKNSKEMGLKVWDKVLCWQYSWDEVKVDGEEFKIVWIDYVLAIVE